MAKISNLNSLTADESASGDLLPVVDISGEQLKKISIQELASAVMKPTISGTLSEPVVITALGGITPPSGFNKVMYVTGPADGITLVTKNPSIAPGTVEGELLELRFVGAVRKLQINHGNGVSQNGNLVAGDEWSIKYFWDGLVWSEQFRRENA